MCTVLEFKTREIEPAIDKDTFLSIILSEQKRNEVLRKLDEMEYEEEQFYLTKPRILSDED